MFLCCISMRSNNDIPQTGILSVRPKTFATVTLVLMPVKLPGPLIAIIFVIFL